MKCIRDKLTDIIWVWSESDHKIIPYITTGYAQTTLDKIPVPAKIVKALSLCENGYCAEE